MTNDEIKQRKFDISIRLDELTKDFVQADLGAEFDDLEERKAEYKSLHNELRILLGKEPRYYKEVDNGN